MKRNAYFTSQTIIDIAGAHGAIQMQYAWGSPVTIKLFSKKLTNKYMKKFGIFNYSRDHSTSIKSTETSWSSPRY